MSGRFKIITAVIAVGMLFISCAGQFWILEIPFRLVGGWFTYLARVVPMVRFNWPAVGLIAIAIPVAMILAHRMAIWLWTGLGNNGSWRWKWTLSIMATVLLMFIAGMSATGVAHQTGWLLNSPKPLVESNWDRRFLAEQLKCASNLRTLHRLIGERAKTNPGYRPATLSELLEIVDDPDFSRELLVCPSAYQEKAPGTQPSEWRSAMLIDARKYVSYLIAPVGTPGPDPTRQVLLYDLDESEHRNGMNILYEDGEVVWLDTPAGRAWLNSIAKSTSIPASMPR